MSYLKNYAPIVVELIKSATILKSAIADTKKLFQQTVREEIRSSLMRVSLVLILSSVIIFSVITVGQQINALLLAQMDGRLWSILVFSGLAILVSLLLVYLFREKFKSVTPEPTLSEIIGLDLQHVAKNFLQGLNEGLEHEHQHRAPPHAPPAPIPFSTYSERELKMRNQ